MHRTYLVFQIVGRAAVVMCECLIVLESQWPSTERIRSKVKGADGERLVQLATALQQNRNDGLRFF